MTTKKAALAAEKARLERDLELAPGTIGRPPCLCGCGGTPKGPKSRFIPGHDARFHAAEKARAKEATESPTATAPPAQAPAKPSRARAIPRVSSRANGEVV